MFKSNSSFIVLYIDNVTLTHEFYKSIGAEIKQLEEDKVVVKIDGHEMHFILASTEPFEDYKYIAKKSDYGNGIVFYVEVDSIEEFYAKVKMTDANLKSKIFQNNWGAKELLFEDPNGFKFAVYQMIN